MIKVLRKVAPPGVRLQLSLWYTAVSACLMLIFGIALYTSLDQLLASSFDTTLQMRAQQIAEGVSVRQGKVIVSGIVDELPELNATAAIVDPSPHNTGTSNGDPEEHTPRIKGIYVRVLDTHHKIIYFTSSFSALTLPPESISNPLSGQPWRGTLLTDGRQPIRIYSTMLVDAKQIVGVVQVGIPLTGLHATMGQIGFAIILFTPFILLLSAFVSYWLAGRAFKPISRLTRMARAIGAKNLHQRVTVPLARDEVHELAVIFNQMIERLESAFVQQRRFVADASHELRTPVAVIRSMTEIALSQPSDNEDYVAVLQEVNAESERLGKLTSDLLALARADEGQIQLDYEPVRLDLLAADVVASLESLATERKITLSTARLDSATVCGDAARLIQVIMSLVDNALIYTNAGGQVTLSVEAYNPHVQLVIHDTGIGIAQKDIEHVFERFYRADPARSKAVGGTGLGLAIVDWVVQAHKGTITVDSEIGKGSTFTVTLPLAAEQS
ncbi:MAG TPA: ATP-binding protein [Ktedonosporobacter sp.]|nr:ATP-binding protein [Ktedonosporobacter sp.]